MVVLTLNSLNLRRVNVAFDLQFMTQNIENKRPLLIRLNLDAFCFNRLHNQRVALIHPFIQLYSGIKRTMLAPLGGPGG